ncbi:response regulator [Rhodoblastus acidophilus]|uniref:histidine kinase n=1 Tax=Candidatus Rhodoblastus alkanivorans TaxID=2954117 RepID=A0ABS9Z1Q0_9HYPH|nr:response regulator [Candidatus Rhodoblastus alkanivorans]MCI4678093.1 response regulator [Candidatus Rhodoblastus alkanivorans]MCI4681566.1 response regulator [Candidatus Rhodoblastus alkanivorans]MDI4642614.1 response regulator [Rhodoblastus acidophilus]
MFSIATSLHLAAVVGSVAALLAAGFCLAPWRERDRARREKEELLDQLWELRAAASALNKAEAANEAKSRFLATVSHEVRTPLTGILGMAELLTATELTAEQMSYVDAVRRSAESLSSLIDEILDFSKIEAGKLDLNLIAFDLTALVEGAAELLAPRAQGKGIEIATSIDRNVPRRVIGDPDRLRQVLMNLAGNAIKFTERGGVGVVLKTSSADRISFSVCDSGPGVPAERREAIFKEFEQADGSFSRKHGGTGLGLSISKALVELMGGQLQLARSGPEGSTFTFEIDLPPAEPSTTVARPASDLGGKTALLVSDSPFGGPFLGRRLAELGARVECVQGESAALEHFKKNAVDLVIIDCALGERATQQLVTAARASGAKQNLVLFSPFERRAFGEALIKDFDGWLVKPVRLSSLYSRLEGGRGANDRRETGAESAFVGKPLEGRSILLAEDNDVNALLVDRRLTRLGAQMTRVCDGAEAVTVVCANVGKFDAILMDMCMPGVDGLAATRQIRAAEQKAGAEPVRIIALTANVSEEDRAAALGAGMNGFLAKPIDSAELVRAVAQK